MSTPVGITVPKLLPITGTFAPLFAGYFTLLSLRVINQRRVHETNFGLPGKPTNPAVAPDSLTLLSRCHQNFTENVPLALILAGMVELNGGNRKVLTVGLSALLAFRVLHVEIGMLGKDTVGIGRPIGYFGTLVWILGAGGYAAYLVKGYWGF